MVLRKKMHSVVIVACAAGALCLSGCANDESSATEATLDVANVQGISFSDPLPASGVEPSSNELAMLSPAEKISAPANVTAELPTAEDVPDDIALIPSATPVPTPPPPAETPEPAQEAVAPADVASAASPGDFQPVSFKVLSGYKYIEPIPNEGDKPEEVEKRRVADQIPADVKALDGKKAIVEGWMVPMEINEDSSVKSFVLVKTQPQCCFGDMQAMNEWVDVMMEPGKNAEFNVDTPVKVYGELEVGEKTEDGFVLSIYRMQAGRVEI